MNELAQIPFQVIRGKQLADGGWVFSVYTPELPSDQLVALTHVGAQGGYLVAKPNLLNPEDIPVEEAPVNSDAPKTKAQRLRASLFVLWDKSNPQNQPDFENFYNLYMEKFIESVKSRIPE